MPTTPIADSYWLIDGQLLAGEYPGSLDDADAARKIRGLLEIGIRSFIDLTEVADPLEPYEPILREVAGELGLDVRYQRLAIPDMGIPTVDLMTTILETIRSELEAGRPVYFHCWGGIGRTGTVAGCWLIEQGYSCDEGLARLKALRDPTPDGWKESTQTKEQKAFVKAWRSGTAAGGQE